MHNSMRSYSILSTFSIIWWEYLTTFDNEFDFIWRRPMNGIKCIFILSRYLPLIVLTINVVLLFGPLSSPHVDISICRASFVLLLCSMFALYDSLELFLIMRVYALYQRSIRVALYLGILMAIEIIFEILCIVVTIKDVKFRSDNCDAKGIPRDVFYFGGSLLLSQLSLWTLTYFRRNIVNGTLPVIRLITRDGLSAFILVCALIAMTLPYSTVSKYSSAYIIFECVAAVLLGNNTFKADIQLANCVGISVDMSHDHEYETTECRQGRFLTFSGSNPDIYNMHY